jgi:hypothetical protein
LYFDLAHLLSLFLRSLNSIVFQTIIWHISQIVCSLKTILISRTNLREKINVSYFILDLNVDP